MNIIKKGLLGAFCCCTLSLGCNSTKQTTMNEDGSYSYQTVENDPMGVKIYTLKNGLRVYMSVVKDAPRIQTYIVTRAGSKNDPADATGLAHYLEHMLFKGSSKIGALDWNKEKGLLKQISDLYEKHRKADPEERAAIYKEIDKLSNDAAKLVAANEYDKMINSLGAKGTNAFTSLDRTAYVNDIPSNELEKWLKIEAERFSELVLRLFHTELETVYEEFNIGQNNDGRKIFKEFMAGLCPTHPYGTQTTIGTGEHLKIPSMEKIHEYFNKYYIPNNMAIVLAGDFDPNQAVKWIEQYWGGFKKKKAPSWSPPTQAPISKPVAKKVFGKEKSRMQIGWRLDGAGTEQALLGKLVSRILYNGKAGLIDINLVQQQKVGSRCWATSWSATDFSFFYMYGEPLEGQTLEQVQKLLVAQVEKLKKGEFEDWMIEAVVNDFEYNEIRSRESLQGRAYSMMDAFIFDREWKDVCDDFKHMRQFTKQDVIDFAKNQLTMASSVSIFKLEEEDPNILKVEKPTITPVSVNRDSMSTFRKEIVKMKTERDKPIFIDFNKAIQTEPLASGIPFSYIKNKNNETFELEYIVDIGENHDNVFPLAIKYLPYLGTDKYTPEQLKQEFFKLGLSFDVYASSDVCYVILTGLDRSFEKGVELFEHILANAKPNEAVLKNMVAEIEKSRLDEKKDKRTIMQRAMSSYAMYGQSSPFRTRLPVALMSGVSTNDMMKRIKRLTQYKHKVFYYGSQDMQSVITVLDKHHKVPEQLLEVPNERQFKQLDTDKNRVLFVNFEGMAQAEIMMVSKGTQGFDLDEYIMNQLYNQYFGSGLSSVVFQEIRESRALAYSAYAYSASPAKKDKAHYLRAYVGTQADKMKEAIPALKGIIEDMPVSKDQIANSTDALLKKLESDRLIKSSIYWNYISTLKKGLDRDLRKDSYERFSELTKDKKKLVQALKDFHANKIKGRNYTYLVLGDKSKLDLEYLKTLGEYQELTLEQLFGY